MPLGKRSDFGDARYAGVEVAFSHDISSDMQVFGGSGRERRGRPPKRRRDVCAHTRARRI